MKYYPDMKKEILPFATTRLDLESVMLSETSPRERQVLYNLSYMQDLKKRAKLIEI